MSMRGRHRLISLLQFLLDQHAETWPMTGALRRATSRAGRLRTTIDALAIKVQSESGLSALAEVRLDSLSSVFETYSPG